MKKKLFALLMLVVIVICSFAACTDTSKPADGYDFLQGTWQVGAIYYKNKLVDLSDNTALSSMYDATIISFTEDGLFSYLNLYAREGAYIRKESINGKETFLLKTENVYTYEFDGEETIKKEKADAEKTSYLLTVHSPDAIEIVRMDPVTGKAKVGENPLVFERSGQNSVYIAQNKTPLN